MIDIDFPVVEYKIRGEKGKEMIFDSFRKQWVLLTPEEWVRQNFLQYLVLEKKYPASLIAVEREIILGDIKKRFDIVVFKDAKPWMVIECKEMNVHLNESTLKQVLNYNIALEVKYIVITNGKTTYGLLLSQKEHTWLDEIPEYNCLQ